MGIVFKNIGLSAVQEDAIEKLLQQKPVNPLELENVWTLMDRVWDEYGCDNQTPDPKKVAKFYQHPVWILNGLFIEQHDLSKQHRETISDWIVSNRNTMRLNKIVDYGGGFGTLARGVAQKDPGIQIDIFEPHPSDFAKTKMKSFNNIRYIQSLNKRYDCLICTDVLEHLPDPLKILSEMIDSVRINGYLLIANNFFPVIKCHLPNTFHLRYTFNIFTRFLGLADSGPCHGSHVTIYRKASEKIPDWGKIRRLEKISIFIFPCLQTIHRHYRIAKKRLKKDYSPQHPL
jgi:ubiquinone/menaquinone biosynthesis C-methylase UbiE